MNQQVQQVLNSLSGLDEKLRYAILAGVLLLVGVIDYFIATQFQLGALKQMNEEIKKVVDDTARVRSDLQRINNIQKGLNDMRSKLTALNSKIHTIQEMPAIFEQISRYANEFHVNIDQLAPSKDTQEALASGPDGKYYAQPIVISAHSGYHMFNRFLAKLEASDILFLVKDLKMDGADKDVINIAISATLKIILIDRTEVADNKGTLKQ